MRSWLLLLALLNAAHGERELRGRVVDPDSLPVAGARVSVVCGQARHDTVSTTDGSFVVAVSDGEPACLVTVSRDGFSPARVEVTRHHRLPLLLELHVAPVTERIDVIEPREASQWGHAIGSLAFEGDDLRRLFTSTEEMIRYATLAGASRAGTVVYVDGLPANILPPPEMVGRLSVTPGPFSPEFGDGDLTAIQLSTRSSSRKLRVRPNGSFLGFGGNGLRSGLHSTSSSNGAGVSGGIPHAPATFAAAISASQADRGIALLAAVPSGAAPFAAEEAGSEPRSTTTMRTGTVNVLFAPTAAVRAHGAYAMSVSSVNNAGVGGLVLPSAGLRSRAESRSGQAGATWTRGTLSFESGFTARASRSSIRANSGGEGLSVNGAFVAGGGVFQSREHERLWWTAKHVVRSSSLRPWLLGALVNGSNQSQQQVANPSGVFSFESSDAFAAALDGAPTATWTIAKGDPAMHYHGLRVSPFASKTLVRANRLQLDAGLRADIQPGAGTALSPRVWFATEWHGFTIEGGTGLFTLPVPDDVFVAAILGDGRHLLPFQATDVRLGGAAPDPRLSGIRTELGPQLRATRQWLHRSAVSRAFGALTTMVEYARTREDGRLGAARSAADGAWIDVIDGMGSAARDRISSSVQYRWKRQTLTGRYEWIRAFDDGDGPFSYAEHPGQLEREWARSAGLAPHGAAFTATLALPLQIYAAVTDSWQSRAPLNVTTGTDDDRNGLFNERGGRPRNGGWLPAQQTLSFHASRRFDVPGSSRWLRDRYRLNLGVHVDNATNRRNYTSVGTVTGSATFATPLTAAASRTLRVTVSID